MTVEYTSFQTQCPNCGGIMIYPPEVVKDFAKVPMDECEFCHTRFRLPPTIIDTEDES